MNYILIKTFHENCQDLRQNDIQSRVFNPVVAAIFNVKVHLNQLRLAIIHELN